MDRISVDLGQFVLTGDPVAAMDGGSQASPTGTSGSKQPVLYVEFRKDGAPIDPSPWWATKRRRKGSRMMRKTSLLFLGALAGVLTTLLITQPRVLLAGSAARAAVSDTYRGLNLFGEVFERVRADYVDKTR